MRFRYDGERTYDPVLGLLEPGLEGDGPDDIVRLKIAAGLLTAVAGIPTEDLAEASPRTRAGKRTGGEHHG